MNPIDPTRLRRSEKEATNRLFMAWTGALGFLLLVLVLLAVLKFGV